MAGATLLALTLVPTAFLVLARRQAASRAARAERAGGRTEPAFV
jgi:hypothetical protein